MGIIDIFLVNVLGWENKQTNLWEKVDDNPADSYGRKTNYYISPSPVRYYFLTTGIDGDEIDYRTYISGGCLEGWSETGLGGVPHSYHDQIGYQYVFTSNEFEGPYTKYHLFGGQEGVDGQYFYCVVETSAGLFNHFGLGQLDRIGSKTGSFAVSLYWSMSISYWRSVTNSHHQRMFDSHSSTYGGRGHLQYHQHTFAPETENYLFGYSSDHCYGGSVGGGGKQNGGINGAFVGDGPSAFNGRTMLMPNHILLDDGASWKRMVGIAPAFRTVMIHNLQAEDIVDTDWMVFPIKAKNTTSGPNSGNYGWAYKFQ